MFQPHLLVAIFTALDQDGLCMPLLQMQEEEETQHAPQLVEDEGGGREEKAALLPLVCARMPRAIFYQPRYYHALSLSLSNLSAEI